MVEADESDRSFLELPRDVAVVTNIELDHHHTYASLAELRATFDEFAAPAGIADRGGPPVPRRGCELKPLGSDFTVEGVPVEL